MTNIRQMTTGEEIANAISHGIGALLSVAMLVLLVVFAGKNGNAWHIVSFALFGAAMVILYTFSTLAHAVQTPEAKRTLVTFDQISIFLLIAGTYTPFTLIVLHGALGWTLFGLEWALAITGIVLKAVFVDKFYKEFRLVATLFYLAMGWPIVFLIGKVATVMPANGLVWLLAGGACYTLGVVFFLLQKHKYLHFIWHLLVMGGSICHFFCVILYVLPIKV